MKTICVLIIQFFLFNSMYSQQNGVLENLGPNVNTTDYLESRPCLSADGKTLFFERDTKNGNGDDIYYSNLNEDGTWGKAMKIEALSNEIDNAVYYVSPDGNTLIIKGIYGPNKTVKGISKSNRTKDGWSEPTQVMIKSVPESWWGFHSITLSSDKQTMILSLNSDLYVSFNENDDTWSEPIKLPDNVNTSEYEYTPFLAPDNKTLYFSTGGHGGMGLNDIYKTVRLDDAWKKWSDPVNVGEPINSPGWESFFSISAKGDYAFVYRLEIGNGDIFRIKLSENIKPQASLLLTGKILNSKTNKAVDATIRFENLDLGKTIGSATASPLNGDYKIILPAGHLYGIFAEAPGFISVTENLDLSKLDTYKEMTKNLMLVPIEVGQTVRLNNIFFDFGKAVLREESFTELNRVVTLFNDKLVTEIEISGHTDNVGADDKNLKISNERANAVKQYLIDKGIAPIQLKAKGYGKTKPVSGNDTEQGRQQNRRVEFTILKIK